MSNTANQDIPEIAKAHVPDAATQGLEKETNAARGSVESEKKEDAHLPTYASSSDDEYDDKPTEEELHTLRRVSGKLNWPVFTIAFAELCERFSYYGSAVLYTNFVNNPLPEGSTTGANFGFEGRNPGALGKGARAAQAISLFNQFFAYLMPLFGAYIADAKIGRYKTVHIAILISTIAHVILTAASAPSVIVKTDTAFGVFILGLLTLCVGTGFFKANISPLLAEQNVDRIRVEVQNGERVIVDPAITNSRIFLYFYFAINIGAVTGQVSMVWVEKYIGFWLAFLLPTILFLAAPLVLWSQKKRYVLSPPTGSVLSKFLKMFWFTWRRSGFGFKKFNWDHARPSHVAISERPSWMTYDDAWVDQVRRGLMACKVFLFLPIFHLAYNQMTGNLTIQAGTMQLNGVPNDIIQNLNPISIVIMIPLFDRLLYPGLEKIGFHFTPIKRMATGFFFGAAAMVAACVMQYYIYQKSPCGEYATSEDCSEPAPINVWAQSLPYILIGISEIFTNVTSYEYAFSKAPENMRSLVMSINLFMSAISAAIGQAWVPLSGDPLLVWNYASVAFVALFGGIGFWFCFKHLDADEDKWNMLKHTKYMGKVLPNAVPRDGEQEREVQSAKA